MRFRIIVLLAVCSNLAAAGPLRHTGVRVQQQNVARFLNHTEIPSIPADNIVLTPIPIPSSSVTSSITTSLEVSAAAATSLAKTATTPLTPAASSSNLAADALVMSTSSQTLSTSATPPVSEHSDTGIGATPVSTSTPVYSGRLFNLGGEPPIDLQSSTNPPSSSSTPSPSRSSLTSSDVRSSFDVQKVAATPSSSLVLNQASEAPQPTSSKAAPVLTSSSFATPIPTSHPAAASQTSSPVVVPVPISSGLIQVLGPGGDTADEFSPVTLDPSLPTPTETMTYPSAEAGNVAMADGFNYAFGKINDDTPCNPGDPKQAYVCIQGDIAECQSDETYVVKKCPSGQTCKALPKPSGQTGIIVQCIVPSDAASILAGSSSSTAAPVAVVSQQTEMLQAEGDFSQATQSVSAQNPVQPVTSSLSAQPTIQSQKVAPISSIPAGMATVQQVHDSNPLNESPKATPSTSLTTAVEATSSISIPKALFAVVTAPQRPSPEVSSPAIQSSATPPSSSTDSPQPAVATVTNTSTSSADSAGITYAPMGVPVNEKAAVGNGQATVTVTVTVTTTEKTAPFTIISS